MMWGLSSLDDSAIVTWCTGLFRQLNSKPDAWDALGPAYHQRLEKNCVTWVHHYVWEGLDRRYSAQELTNRPIAWSVGGFSEVWLGVSNIRVAESAGIGVEILPCKHFPQVEIPEILANHIRAQAQAQRS
jgi:hypothetical protein